MIASDALKSLNQTMISSVGHFWLCPSELRSALEPLPETLRHIARSAAEEEARGRIKAPVDDEGRSGVQVYVESLLEAAGHIERAIRAINEAEHHGRIDNA